MDDQNQLYNSFDRDLYRADGDNEDMVYDPTGASEGSTAPDGNASAFPDSVQTSGDSAVTVSPDQISSGSQAATVNQVVGNLANGKSTFDNTKTGFILGVDKGVAKFYIGNTTNYISWDGSTLSVVGGVSISQLDIPDTITANSFHVSTSGNTWWGAAAIGSAVAKVLATGAATFTNIVATGTINATGGYVGSASTALAVESGGFNVGTTGYIRGNQTDFNTGVGWFLGYSGGAYKFSVGDPNGQYITWDGSTLAVTSSQLLQSFTAAETITGIIPVYLKPVQSDGGILLDNTKFSGASGNVSTSFTVGSNSNRVLVICVAVGGAGPPTISPPTYNGVSATLVDSSSLGTVGIMSTYILVAPATGANTLAVTVTGSNNTEMAVYSYYNCAQSAQPDNHSTSGGSFSVASRTTSLTPVNNASLTVSFGVSIGQSALATLTTTAGFTNNTGNGNFSSGGNWQPSIYVGDSGVISPPSLVTTTVTLSNSPSNGAAVFQIALKPFTDPAYQVAPASASATSTSNSFIGFSTGSIASGASGKIIVEGVVTGLSGLFGGSQYYIANSAGTIAITAGSVTRKAGIAMSSTSLLITNIW